MIEDRPHRKEKIAELLHREVAKLIKEEADLPVELMVTVSQVEVSANHQHATVVVTVFPFERSGEVEKELNRIIREIQRRLNRALKMRPVPQIRFKVDEGEEKGHRILGLIEGVDESDKTS